MIMDVAVFIAAVVVMMVCLVLVLHKHYEDGLLGRIALGAIGICAFARAAGIAESEGDAYVSTVGSVLWVALAVFLGRHLTLFLLRRHRGGRDWRQSTKSASGGKLG